MLGDIWLRRDFFFDPFIIMYSGNGSFDIGIFGIQLDYWEKLRRLFYCSLGCLLVDGSIQEECNE